MGLHKIRKLERACGKARRQMVLAVSSHLLLVLLLEAWWEGLGGVAGIVGQGGGWLGGAVGGAVIFAAVGGGEARGRLLSVLLTWGVLLGIIT